MSKKTIFSDEISDLHFAGGMIRMDLGTINTDEEQIEGQEPILNSNRQIIMPSEGFLKSFNNMQLFVSKLIEAGILAKDQNNEEQS